MPEWVRPERVGQHHKDDGNTLATAVRWVPSGTSVRIVQGEYSGRTGTISRCVALNDCCTTGSSSYYSVALDDDDALELVCHESHFDRHHRAWADTLSDTRHILLPHATGCSTFLFTSGPNLDRHYKSDSRTVDLSTLQDLPTPPYDFASFPGVSLIFDKARTNEDEFTALGALLSLFEESNRGGMPTHAAPAGGDAASTTTTPTTALGSQPPAPPAPAAASSGKTDQKCLADASAEKGQDPCGRQEVAEAGVGGTAGQPAEVFPIDPSDVAGFGSEEVVQKYIRRFAGSPDAVREALCNTHPAAQAIALCLPSQEATGELALSTTSIPSLSASTLSSIWDTLHDSGLDILDTQEPLLAIASTHGPGFATALIWVAFVMNRCTINHAPTPADPAAAKPVPSPPLQPSGGGTAAAAARPLVRSIPPPGCDDVYGKVGWSPAPASQEKVARTGPGDLGFMQGLWVTLKERTPVSVTGGKVRFRVGGVGASFGTPWDVVADESGIYLLGSRLSEATSTTATLRWDDGDVWYQVQEEAQLDQLGAGPEFGLISPAKSAGRVPRPPGAAVSGVQQQQQAKRPMSAPATSQAGCGAAQRELVVAEGGALVSCQYDPPFKCDNAAWGATDYANKIVHQQLMLLTDGKLREEFDRLDKTGDGRITRRALEDYFDSLDHLGVRCKKFVDRVLATVSHGLDDSDEVGFDEFALVYLRMAAR